MVVSSRALLQPVEDDVVEACLAGDEQSAVSLSEAKPEELKEHLYATSKRAVARWVRRHAATPHWAGAGIPLNAVGPGSVITPMTAANRSPEAQERVLRERPMPAGSTWKWAPSSPLPLPPLNIGMAWHPRHTADGAHHWLRDAVRRVLQTPGSTLHTPVNAT